MRIRPEKLGTFAVFSSCVLWGNTPTAAGPLRPSIEAPRWSGATVSSPEAQFASRLMDEVEQQWRATELLMIESNEQDFDILKDVLSAEALGFAAPVGVTPVQLRVRSVRAGQPHSAPLDDFDAELLESLHGEL